MNIEKLSNKQGPVKVIGSVDNVIRGEFPEALRQHTFSATDYQYGFEIASVKGIDALGEAIMLNGRCYVKSTGEYRGDVTHSSDQFMSSGMFLIPWETEPAYRLHNPSKEGHALSSLYRTIFEHVQQAFCIVGCVHLESATVAAINKAPIYGDNIFEHIDDYYTTTAVPIAQQDAFIFAAVTDYGRDDLGAVNQALKTVLYNNPFDQSASLTTHVHALTLKRSVVSPRDIDMSVAQDAWHLFEKDCWLTFDSLDIFPVDTVETIA